LAVCNNAYESIEPVPNQPWGARSLPRYFGGADGPAPARRAAVGGDRCPVRDRRLQCATSDRCHRAGLRAGGPGLVLFGPPSRGTFAPLLVQAGPLGCLLLRTNRTFIRPLRHIRRGGREVRARIEPVDAPTLRRLEN